MFGGADGLVFVEEALDVGLIGGGIVAWQQDGAAGETGFDGVQRRFGFAFGSFGAGRKLSLRGWHSVVRLKTC